MKTTQIRILAVITSALLLTGCNPSKLSSHYSINSTSEIAKAGPEKEAINVEQKMALYAQALEKMNKNATFLTVQNAAKTNWIYLGYQAKMLTTDSRGNVLNRVSRANTKLNFSDLQVDSCTASMVCVAVYLPFVTVQLASECQKASYRMHERIIMGGSTAPESNFSWTILTGEKTPNCSGTDEDEFFTVLSREIIRNDPLIFVSDNFLYIQSSGLTFIFTK